ncbi:MAG: hypothetical protein MUF35_00040 [Candidatus Nanopelagicales bacterium]|jgi:predicted alpha-1,6-mannanase (GH76 family)|nr:hypothetical protein [Candidatus Nanopelagicales bacterium]
MDWSDCAQQAREVLVARYWDERSGLFRVGAGLPGRIGVLLPGAPWHPWWQAQALEVLLDGVGTDPGASARAPRLVDGIAAGQGGDLTRTAFVDDLAWLGLATWRAHTLGVLGPEPALALAAAVLAGHDPVLGGFRWRFGDDYHNVPATAPAAMLLARTAALAGAPTRLDLARATAEWLHAHVVEPSGVVRDGCRPRQGRLVAEGPLWSYNVGTVAGLDVVLADEARDDAERGWRLDRAAWVLRAGTRVLGADTDGIWRDERHDGQGVDPQLFRGILARHLADLVLADPAGAPDLAEDLRRQAAAAWSARDGRGRIGAAWTGRRSAGGSPARSTLAAHLAGALVLASTARLPGRSP